MVASFNQSQLFWSIQILSVRVDCSEYSTLKVYSFLESVGQELPKSVVPMIMYESMFKYLIHPSTSHYCVGGSIVKMYY